MVLEEFTLEPHHMRLLRLACEAWDRCQQAGEILDRDGLTTQTEIGGLWNVPFREGKHEPIIDLETYEKNQARLSAKPKAALRRDTSEDFPLRGSVLCDSRGRPLTGCWSKGRNKSYPYYLCQKRGCENKGKSIPKQVM